EMDASVMTWDLRCGAVGNLRRVRHPVSVARAVMEKTDHVLLVGQGALRFARALGVPDYDPVTPERRQRWEEVCRSIRDGDPKAFEQHELRFWQKLSDLAGEYLPAAERGKRGTVGCVACDAKGRVAAATSTGGIWFKLPGRIGDTPLFGAGTYANGDGAASATGHGEGIIRVGLTKVAVDAMATLPAEEAVARAMEVAGKAGVECGLIAVDRRGGLAEGKTADFMGTARARW
ncbi:MAG: isoaspartyl peptidase/L-asparaginase, partial [Planctomycetales bacterium]|nr:isoaspartyl peptidase/L-asparaginase [Planctomycetales bacterium]